MLYIYKQVKKLKVLKNEFNKNVNNCDLYHSITLKTSAWLR